MKPQRVISVTVSEAGTFTLYIAMKIRGRSLAVCLGLVCLSAAHGQQYTIQTLTGNGSAGFVGDGGDPAAAQLSSPQSVALDSKGNLYIADTGNQVVRKVDTSGIIKIVGTAPLELQHCLGEQRRGRQRPCRVVDDHQVAVRSRSKRRAHRF